MLAQSSPMEIMRQFLAAFAGSDKNGLYQLLAHDASLKISKQNMRFQSDSRPRIVDFLLAETAVWSRERIDVQSWSSEKEQLVVKFHANVQQNGRLEDMAYTLFLTVQDPFVQSVKIRCDESVATAESVWQVPKQVNYCFAG